MDSAYDDSVHDEISIGANASGDNTFDSNKCVNIESADQSICGVEYDLHKNLSSAFTSDANISAISELSQHFLNVCLDPESHNSLVAAMNEILNGLNNPNISASLGNTFYWIKKIIKNDRFKIIWYDTMKGVNMLFDDPATMETLMNTLFDNLEIVLTEPSFDYSFDTMMKAIKSMMNLHKNVMYKAGALLSKPIESYQRSASKNGRR